MLHKEKRRGITISVNTTRPANSKVRLASMPYVDVGKWTNSSGLPVMVSNTNY